MTEIPITAPPDDFTQPGGPAVFGWGVAARILEGNMPGPITWVWTVPPGVRSVSMLVVGGYAGWLGFSVPSHARRFFRRIPVTPGDEWLMEPGGGPAYIQPAAPAEDSRAKGGRGGTHHPYGWGQGWAGGGGTLVGPRTGGPGGAWFAVAAGRGGLSINQVPDGWEGTYGSPADQVAGEHRSDPTDRFYVWGAAPPPSYEGAGTLEVAAGGGAGGWVGGSAGAAWQPGEGGWSYWPDTDTFDGPPSPSMSECQTTDVPPSDDAYGDARGLGAVRWWWYGPQQGWNVGHIAW